MPVVNPASAAGLVRLAGILAAGEDGSVMPFTVVHPRAGTRKLDAAWDLVTSAAGHAEAAGATAHALVSLHDSVTAGVLEGIEDEAASLVIMGWEGVSTRQNVFDVLVDTLVGTSAVPVVVARLRAETTNRVLLAISDDDLLPAGIAGLELSVQIARRLCEAAGCTLVALHTGLEAGGLPSTVTDAADEVRRDERRGDHVVGDEAGVGDVVVVPVSPTESGLRTASTRTAWATPDASLVVVVDVGRSGG